MADLLEAREQVKRLQTELDGARPVLDAADAWDRRHPAKPGAFVPVALRALRAAVHARRAAAEKPGGPMQVIDLFEALKRSLEGRQ
jgi:hypothetical protein